MGLGFAVTAEVVLQEVKKQLAHYSARCLEVGEYMLCQDPRCNSACSSERKPGSKLILPEICFANQSSMPMCVDSGQPTSIALDLDLVLGIVIVVLIIGIAGVVWVFRRRREENATDEAAHALRPVGRSASA